MKRRGDEIQVVSTAKLRYLRSSAQKTRLVIDQVRGQRVDAARSLLRASRKAVARDILKLLMSAVANTENADGGAAVDADELFVVSAQVDEGPAVKRIRPAPMGRAFPIQKRQCHVQIALGTYGKA